MIDNQTFENCFSTLGTEYVCHNIKKINLNGYPNSYNKGEWILENLASEQGELFDLLCTQVCSPQRVYHFHVLQKFESKEDDSFFYILDFQPSDLEVLNVKFAFEEFSHDDKKRRIYIYEDLRTINDPSYSLIPDIEIVMSKMQLCMAINKAKLTNDERNLLQLLKRCYLRIKSVYESNKIIIR